MKTTVDSGPRATDAAPAPHEPLTRELLRLVDQSLWANLRWVEFVYAQPDPEGDPEARPRALLAHVMLAERVWLERVEGRQRTGETFLVLSKDELARGFAENAETFRRLIGSRLEDVIDFRRGDGAEYHARVADVLHHLITHGYHHRGQLAAHFARGGVEYPSTDHIDFLIQNRL